MNSQCQENHNEVDISNFMLLVDVCCIEQAGDLWKVFPKRKRTKFLPSHSTSKPNLNPNREENEESLHHVMPLLPLSENNNFAKAIAIATSLPSKSICIRTGANDDQERSKSIKIEKATATKPSKSKNRKDQQPLSEKKEKIERPATTPMWVEQLARTQLHNARPPAWLCGKKLTDTDVTHHHDRLFIPKEGVENLFKELTQWEKEMVPIGIPVIGLDEDGRAWALRLKLWPSLKQHVLTKNWFHLVHANHFKEKDIIHLWFCRYGSEEPDDEKFCFLVGRK